MHDRSPDDLVLTSNHNSVNEYSLRWGFEEACHRAAIVYGETKRGGIIWTIFVDLRYEVTCEGRPTVARTAFRNTAQYQVSINPLVQ